jgi:3-(3-hydroxy-phenyl)propionate hydroxylase
MFMIGDPARPTSVIPGAGRHRRWEFMLLPGESAEEIVRPARVAALLSPWIGNQRFELVRCAVYHFHALLARRWQDGRIFLLGDSAHQTPPFFGQGLCHGIRDAANLSWKLQYVLKRNAAPALLDSYLPERLPQVRGVIEASIHTGRYICTLDPNVAARRDASMRATAAQTTPGYVDIIPGLTAGILDSAREVSAPVGSRFIQPPMTDAFGARRLLDDFTGRDFVMLSLDEIEPLALDREPSLRPSVVRYFVIAKTDASNSPAGSQVLIDSTGEMLRWFEHYACRGVLLRPDAYVFGVFSTDGQAVALLASLQAQLGIHI